jgi:hypothetical protein
LKTILMTLLATLSMNAFSQENTLLRCTTVGDALSEVLVVADSKKDEYLKIVNMDSSTQSYILTTKFEISKSESRFFIGAADLDQMYGGEVKDAIMLQLDKRGRTATLSHRGSVFFLVCQ